MMTTAGVCPSSGTATPGYQRALENVDASEQSGLAVPEDGHTPASPLPPTGCVSDPGLTGISGHAFSFMNEVLISLNCGYFHFRQMKPLLSGDFHIKHHQAGLNNFLMAFGRFL